MCTRVHFTFTFTLKEDVRISKNVNLEGEEVLVVSSRRDVRSRRDDCPTVRRKVTLYLIPSLKGKNQTKFMNETEFCAL